MGVEINSLLDDRNFIICNLRKIHKNYIAFINPAKNIPRIIAS